MITKPHEGILCNYAQKKVKYGGGKVMVWGCFSSVRTSPLVHVKETMDKELYKSILVRRARVTFFNQVKAVLQQEADL